MLKKRLGKGEQGFWNGGPNPFDYRSKDSKLVGVPEEAEIVKRMFDVYKGTKSGNKLRVDLDLMARGQGLGHVFLKVLWSYAR